MNLQKLFLVVLVFFLLPSLGRGQQVEYVEYLECPEAEKKVLTNLLSKEKGIDVSFFGSPEVPVRKIICGDFWAAGGYDGIITMPFLSKFSAQQDFERVFFHELAHSRTGKWVPYWPLGEGLADFSSYQLLARFAPPALSSEAILRRAIRKAGTYNQCPMVSGNPTNDDYGLLALAIFRIAAANDPPDLASNWTNSSVIRRAYAALGKGLLGIQAPKYLDYPEAIEKLSAEFLLPIDGLKLGDWMGRQKALASVRENGPFAEAITLQKVLSEHYETWGPTARNPDAFQILSFGYLPPQNGEVFLRRVWYPFKGFRVRVLAWDERVEYDDIVQAGNPVPLPKLIEGAYTIEIWSLDGSLLHQNHFAIWSGPGVAILKIGSKGEVTQFPIDKVENAVLLHDGSGLLVVGPICRDIHPCTIGVGANGKQFSRTILTPFHEDQIVRLDHAGPTPTFPPRHR